MYIIMNFLIFFCCFNIILSALFVILSKNPVHSIIFLILVFLNAVFLLIFLNMDFMAMLFLIIYVGAIAVLFLFVVMMLNIRIVVLEGQFFRFLPIGFIASILFLMQFFFIIKENFFNDFVSTDFSFLTLNNWSTFLYSNYNIVSLAELLFVHNFMLFIISSFILLIAMVGSIVLTLNIKKKLFIKKQNIFVQEMRNNLIKF